jgi:hypothetical protein
VVKDVFENNLEDRRKVGGLRLRCMEELEDDIGELKVKMWMQKANNGRNWGEAVSVTGHGGP